MPEFNVEERVRELAGSPENHCFVCSQTNARGLQLHFERRGDVVRTLFVPDAWHEGWHGVVHGGILAAVLDETMAYTLFLDGLMGMTARMELRYRAPAYRGEELEVCAWITRSTRKLADIEGRIARGTEVIAEAVGRFIKTGELKASAVVGVETDGRKG